MIARTDNPALVGTHIFERAGLGRGPFRCVGCEWRTYTPPGTSIEMVGGSCDYCGTGIKLFCWIEGADKKLFKVGSDCVAKTGDAGLIRSYKNRPEVRKAAAEARRRLDAAKIDAWKAIMDDPAKRAKLETFHIALPAWKGNGTETWLAMALRVYPMCGAAGRARYLKQAKALLAITPEAVGLVKREEGK